MGLASERELMIRMAKFLYDGAENPEYLRGMVELIHYCTPLDNDDIDVDTDIDEIKKAITSEAKGNKMEIGDRVKIKPGATSWMKEHNYWLPDMGENIDGYGGKIVADYTNLPGDDAHFGVNIGFDFIVGVNPQFLERV